MRRATRSVTQSVHTVPGAGSVPADEVGLVDGPDARAVVVGDVVLALPGHEHAVLELGGEALGPHVRRGRVLGGAHHQDGRRPDGRRRPAGLRVGGTGHTAQAASPQASSGPNTGACTAACAARARRPGHASRDGVVEAVDGGLGVDGIGASHWWCRWSPCRARGAPFPAAAAARAFASVGQSERA